MKKSYFKLILSIIISLSLFYYVLRQFDVSSTLNFIQNARLDYLFLAFLLIISAYSARGFRWMIWQTDLTYKDSLKLILIGFMGNNLLPARLGEILRAHCTARKTGDQYGGTAALASITIERVLDGLILSWIGFCGLFLVSVNKRLFYALLVVSIGFVVLTVSMLVGIYFHKRIRNVFEAIHKMFPGHLTQFGKEKMNYFLDGLLLIRGLRKFFIAIFSTAFIWVIEILAYYFIANAVISGIPIKICFMFLAVVNFSALVQFNIMHVTD